MICHAKEGSLVMDQQNTHRTQPTYANSKNGVVFGISSLPLSVKYPQCRRTHTLYIIGDMEVNNTNTTAT